MVNIKNTHLTGRQFKVLRLRMAGKSLSEISKELHTSRSNISSVARTAEENVKKARNTLKLMELLDWPLKMDVKAGSNIYEVSERFFKEADNKRIKISHNYSEIVRLITETLGATNLKQRKTLKDFSIAVSKDGRVEIF